MPAVARIEDFRHGRVPRAVRERQLVELGEQLFAERGFAKASMDELARRAGVTKPVIYELFGSKEGLFRGLPRGARAAARGADRRGRARRGRIPRRGCGPAGSPSSASPPRTASPTSFSTRAASRMPPSVSGRRQAALILELMREMAPDDVDPRELEVAAHAVNSAYEGVAHWMWEHPESDVEQLADWTVELLLPGLRRFT